MPAQYSGGGTFDWPAGGTQPAAPSWAGTWRGGGTGRAGASSRGGTVRRRTPAATENSAEREQRS